jgi:hypothetical protein
MLFIISTLLSFGVGLIVGWNFISQPSFIKTAIEGLIAKFKKK